MTDHTLFSEGSERPFSPRGPNPCVVKLFQGIIRAVCAIIDSFHFLLPGGRGAADAAAAAAAALAAADTETDAAEVPELEEAGAATSGGNGVVETNGTVANDENGTTGAPGAGGRPQGVIAETLSPADMEHALIKRVLPALQVS